MDNELKSLSQVQNVVTDMALRFGPRVLAAVLILAAGVMAGRWVGMATERALARFALEPPVRELLVRVVRVLVLGLFAIMALQNIGVELLPLIAGLGVVGAGVALAAQGVLGNMIAGLTIIFTRPYRVGEFIGTAGVEGSVESITLFNTILSHADRSQVVVPNRKVVGEILHNYGRIRQTEMTIRVAYGADLKMALATLSEVLRADPRVLGEPAPVVRIAALADSAVLISARPWVAVGDYGAVETDLSLNIVEGLRQRRIEMPLPQYEVRLHGSQPSLPV